MPLTRIIWELSCRQAFGVKYVLSFKRLIVWPKKVLLKSTSSPLYNQSHTTKILCRTSGVNFTIILLAAFAPTDFWHMTKSMQRKRGAFLLVVCTSDVRPDFVVKSESHLLRQMLCASIFALCAKGLAKLTPSSNAHNSTLTLQFC